jgi:hypothetical protein
VRYPIDQILDKALARTGWSQRQMCDHLGCGKNSIKAWLDNGAPYYIVLALEHISEAR